MSLKDEPIEGSGDNFWDIDGYKKTVKWVEDGMFMCNEMIKLINERAEIENKYATKLKLWSQKWSESLEKGPEYGLHKGVLLSSFGEAESLAEVHIHIRDQLTDVQNTVKKWRNENYTKQVVGICKEAKLLEEEFKKAQKPWVKRLVKWQKSKKMMQVAESNERLIINQRDNPHLNEEQIKKLTDRLDKAKKETEGCLEKLDASTKELSSYEPIYAADMECVYEKAELIENRRLDFVKDLLISIHGCVDISVNNTIPHIYMQFRKTIENCDSKKDLMWWALNHGVNMSRVLPSNQVVNGTSSQFNSLKKQSMIEKNIRLSHAPNPPIASDPVDSFAPSTHNTSTIPKQNILAKRVESYDAHLNPFGDETSPTQTDMQLNLTIVSAGSQASPRQNNLPPQSSINSAPKVNERKVENPFEEEEEIMEADNNGVAMLVAEERMMEVTVEAIFDYVGQEDDELTFKIGDRFLKLEDRDDQGWCKGRIGDKIGLYPDNYVKPVHRVA